MKTIIRDEKKLTVEKLRVREHYFIMVLILLIPSISFKPSLNGIPVLLYKSFFIFMRSLETEFFHQYGVHRLLDISVFTWCYFSTWSAISELVLTAMFLPAEDKKKSGYDFNYQYGMKELERFFLFL